MVLDKAIGVASFGGLFSNYTIPCGDPGCQACPGKIAELGGKFARPSEFCKRLRDSA